jgi:hypothetical protein
MTNKPMDLLIAEEFEYKGEQRTKFHNVGTVFENEREGFTVKIHPGLSVSGRLVILPRKEKRDDAAEA